GVAFLARQKDLYLLKQRPLSGSGKFALQAVKGSAEQSQGPLLLEKLLGREVGAGDCQVLLFGGGVIQRTEREFAAPLLGVGTAPFVGQKVLQGGQQEGAKPAFPAVHRPQIILLQQAGKKRLGQILRLRPFIASPPYECVKGKP